MKIVIETIPHAEQRYPTVGDWQFSPDGTLTIRVSAMSDWRHEVLVGLHETIEALLCKQAGVTEDAVDRFDMDYEEKRAEGDDSEPGDDPACPCYRQHQVATAMERVIASHLNVDWRKYEAEIYSL